MNSRKKMHFEVSERKVLLRVFDFLSVLAVLYIVGQLFDFVYFDISLTNYSWTLVLGLYLTVIGTVFEMYNLQVAANEFQMVKSIVMTTCVTVLAYVLTPIFTPLLPPARIQILYFFLSVLSALFIWRYIYIRFLASNRFVKKAVLVCETDQVQKFISGLDQVQSHYKIIGYVSADDSEENPAGPSRIPPESLEKFVTRTGVSEIVVASQKTFGVTAELYHVLLQLLEKGYNIREYTQVYEAATRRIPLQHVDRDFYRFFPFSRSNQNHLYLLVVRIVELLLSAMGILVGILLLPMVIIGNFIGNRGPLFYTQERVGRNGKPFQIVKFRTMVKNAERHGAVFAATNDVRITPFGKFMRKARIDEFPQFYNIFKGEMAVIGPRPERPVFVEKIAAVMPFYQTRHIIKPGLTGWAQVNYSYGDSIEDSLMKLQYDLYYIKHRSIFLDINIVMKTLSTVLFYRGQ